jgi:hypothetical protein
MTKETKKPKSPIQYLFLKGKFTKTQRGRQKRKQQQFLKKDLKNMKLPKKIASQKRTFD